MAIFSCYYLWYFIFDIIVFKNLPNDCLSPIAQFAKVSNFGFSKTLITAEQDWMYNLYG
ncbi:conserved hypothetical protein [Sphingobacterium multivorum]|uniref:Uncharacterized protein n=1 Tax=Sphingobacterium multivorum TaxID=28454 RepID=A0A654BSS9_SPHMU|nr:conserved hypothetical protein [Sphingobacterium multivorum]